MSNSYTAENVRIVNVGMKNHLLCVGKPKLIDMLRQVAQRMVDIVDGVFTPMPPYEPGGNEAFPVWRGHMHDATGVAIYDDGVTIAYLPTKKAIKKQTFEGRRIVGSVELRNSINEGATHFSKGLWIVLFSAVPYAYEVNELGSPADRGQGYFDTLSDDFFKDILMGLDAINL